MPLARGVAQGEVWDEVRAKAARMYTSSPTMANADTFRSHDRQLRRLDDAFPAQPGQSGAILGLGGELCLDYVSRPEALERFWPKLHAGHLLDGLERLDGKPTPYSRIELFCTEIGRALETRGSSAGLGEDVRLRGDGVIGSALELDGETIQLSAFSSRDGASVQRIARPSRRR